MREKRHFMHVLSSASVLALIAVSGALAEPAAVTPEEAALWPKAELARQACRVYRLNCYRCHRQGGFAEDVMDFVMDAEKLVASRKITPNDLRKSPAYKLPAAGDMPPDASILNPEPPLIAKWGPPKKLTADQVLGLWVLAGAPAWQTTGSGDELECK